MTQESNADPTFDQITDPQRIEDLPESERLEYDTWLEGLQEASNRE